MGFDSLWPNFLIYHFNVFPQHPRFDRKSKRGLYSKFPTSQLTRLNEYLKYPMFTQKHYVAAAEVIADLPSGLDEPYWTMADTSSREQIAKGFCELFESKNKKFDRNRFLDACGVEEDSVIRDKSLIEVMGRHTQA